MMLKSWKVLNRFDYKAKNISPISFKKRYLRGKCELTKE